MASPPPLPVIRTLAIACPPDIRTALAPPVEWFDPDGYLVIWTAPDKFAPEDDVIGDPKYQVTFRRLRSRPVRTIRGYRIVVSESRADMYYLVDAIAQFTNTAEVQVKDYLRPEWQDYAAAKAAHTEPCTLRLGKIHSVTPTGGMVGHGTVGWYMGEGSGDFTFSFQEAQNR